MLVAVSMLRPLRPLLVRGPAAPAAKRLPPGLVPFLRQGVLSQLDCGVVLLPRPSHAPRLRALVLHVVPLLSVPPAAFGEKLRGHLRLFELRLEQRFRWENYLACGRNSLQPASVAAQRAPESVVRIDLL